MNRSVRIHPSDNVAVAVEKLSKGDQCFGVLLRDDIPAGHKWALRDIALDEPVVKYGFSIGTATETIPAGSRVHVMNLRTGLNESTPKPDFEGGGEHGFDAEPAGTFSGFDRPDGRVGIRNELWVVPLVGCVNGFVDSLAQAGGDLPIVALKHPYGCSQVGDDLENTAKLLAALAKHPNAAGTLVVSLGCENNTLESFLPRLGSFDRDRIRFLRMQDPGDEWDRGRDLLRALAEIAKTDRRTDVSLDRLVVGLKCGGSDGFSGLSANPLLGAFSDRLSSAGGTTLMTEVPEMFGAESLLAARCRDRDVYDKCFRMLDDYRRYFTDHERPVYENPSPGNIDGGLSTLEEKSLGCTQKGGSADLVDVLGYAEPIGKTGPQLIAAPGNDLVSSTALAAAGAQLILFTTGRGTPFGTIVPTIKISSNSELFRNKPRWIDFDAGRLLEGTSMEFLSDELLKFVLQVASGKRLTKNETNGFRDIAIFKNGVTL